MEEYIDILSLPSATSIDGTEYIEIVQGGVNKKVQISELLSGSSTPPTEEIFTNQTGLGLDITLSTIPNYVLVFKDSAKLYLGIDYTITTNTIEFLYTFESSTISVTKF